VQTAGADVFAFMAVWAPDADPLEDLPTIVSTDSAASLEGSSLRAAFELVTSADERSAGSARLDAELTASGAPMVWSNDGRDGNRRFMVEQITQLLTVDGTLIVDLFDAPHAEVELSACGASTDSATFFASNPNAWVYGGKQVFVSCEWVTDTGAISVFAVSDDSLALSQVVVVDGDRVLLGMADHLLSTSAYEAAAELIDVSSGEVAGGIIADATLSPSGDRITENVRIDPYRLSTVGERLSVTGSLKLDLGVGPLAITMDDTACRAGDVRAQVQERIPRG
jgi:hypothetical protein